MAGRIGNGKNGSSPGIGAGYPRFRLAKALRRALATGDETAARKVAQWQRVLQGMFSGELSVGSRTPVAETPPWVTLEVVTGGFATGAMVAGGDLRPHERELASELGIPLGRETRALLNGYFLSENGQTRLAAMAETGHFRLEAPEEGALLVVSWLLHHDGADAAGGLLDHLVPYFDRLRFFPVPSADGTNSSDEVFLQTVGETIKALWRVQPQKQIEAQTEAIGVWTPLYDRAVQLLLETVEGDPPHVLRDEAGPPLRDDRGLDRVGGGEVCRRTPPTWTERARALLADYREATTRHRPSRRWRSKGGSFQRFLAAIDTHAHNGAIPAGERAHLRRALAHYLCNWDTPGSQTHRARRQTQARQCDSPRYHHIARLLVLRLDRLPKMEGLSDPSAAGRPIDADECTEAVPAGTVIPPHLVRKVGRAQVATVEDLRRQGYITSADVLAEVLPQITSQIRAASLRDAEIRSIFAHVYRAFRQRRSLLLLNLESQVKLEELPWISVLQAYRTESLADRDLARTVMHDVASLALTSFPYAIIPNRLVAELQSLAKQADLQIPFVNEIAADIFMGLFAPTHVEAARLAGRMLAGSLYERYYGIDFAVIRELDANTDHDGQAQGGAFRPWIARKGTEAGNETIQSFAALCHSLAGANDRSRRSVARNGTVIEQQQILTTQNLAPLLHALELEDSLRPLLPDLARDCFRWICRRQQLRLAAYRARLIMLKNTAYAWRQMIFFASLLDLPEQRAFLDWMRDHLAEQSAGFRSRFEPAVAGLASAIEGRSTTQDGGRRFLGWTIGEHWLMPGDDGGSAIRG